MSKSQSVASFASPGFQVYFSVAKLQNGCVPEIAVVEEEELKDPGVDGNRYRRIYRQFPVFTMNTIADWASRAAGDDLTQTYYKLVGQVVSMVITLGGVTKRFSKVKIRNVTPTQVAGQMVGFGAETASVGVTFAAWELQVVEV